MSTATASAFGRINLIGDHTDYNLGLALPMTLPLRTTVRADLRSDWQIVVSSSAFHHEPPAAFDAGAWVREGRWTDYVRAASALLSREGIFEHGASIAIDSDIPPGAGLASSAALCVALVRALADLGGVSLEPARIAHLARAIETDFVGVPVGLMDQLAALGLPHRAQLIDFLDERITPVAVPRKLSVEIVDTGILHENRGGGYAERRAECARAAELLGVASLRQIDDAEAAASLPDPLPRRVRHVVSENQRVRDMSAALAAGDTTRIGPLMAASHASLRDDYEVSLPAIDALVDRTAATPGVIGARLTGGGFGGSVVVIRVTE